MDCWLEKAAAKTVLIGPFVDVTDPSTRLTGLNLLYTDIKISKNGGSFASKNDATKPSHLGNGYFDCVLDATDTGSSGQLSIVVNESTAFPVRHDFQVVPSNVWDSLVGGTDYLQTTSITGDGAYSVTITVDDGSDALEGATVRLKQNDANNNVGVTNASGQVSFSLDAATYTVSISLTGYSFTPTTLAVSASGSQTYSMSSLAISPSAVGQTTGYFTTYDEDGVAEAGVEIECVLHTPASGVLGIAYDTKPRTETSDADGLVQFTNLFKGAIYEFRRGSRDVERWQVTVPSGAGDSVALTSIAGQDD